jgi:hypothetical protein
MLNMDPPSHPLLSLKHSPRFVPGLQQPQNQLSAIPSPASSCLGKDNSAIPKVPQGPMDIVEPLTHELAERLNSTVA